MREDQRRAALHQPIERLLDDRLVLGIDRGERLVEDQDGGVAEQRAGDGDALALATGQPDAALAHHRLIALRQARDELVGVGAAGGRAQIVQRRPGLAEAEVVLDGAVEEVRVLLHDGDLRAKVLEAQRAHVAAADADAPALGIVEAQEQSRDRGLAGAARPHESDSLARRHREAQALVGGAAAAGIRERHLLEGDTRRERRDARARLALLPHLGRGAQDRENALRGRGAEHALMQHDAQLAQGPEDLDAEHEDDEQARQPHRARLDAIHAERQRGHRADGDPRVGDATRHHVGAEHPHGALKQRAPLVFEQAAARRALAEGLERRQPLQRIEELGAIRRVRLLPGEAVPALPAMPERRGAQRHQRSGQRDQRHRQVDERDEGEDQHGRETRHDELRQVLAEVDLELLDALDHREHHVARPRAAEVRGAERGDVRVERAPQGRLRESGGVVGHHRPVILERAAHHGDGGDQPDAEQQRRQRRRRQDSGQQPAEQREPRDAGGDGGEADRHRPRDAQAHARGEAPELAAQVHASSPLTAPSTLPAVGQSRPPQQPPGSRSTARRPTRRAPRTSME